VAANLFSTGLLIALSSEEAHTVTGLISFSSLIFKTKQNETNFKQVPWSTFCCCNEILENQLFIRERNLFWLLVLEIGKSLIGQWHWVRALCCLIAWWKLEGQVGMCEGRLHFLTHSLVTHPDL
jgi:hypothetical protein